jgi:hypothetical protein
MHDTVEPEAQPPERAQNGEAAFGPTALVLLTLGAALLGIALPWHGIGLLIHLLGFVCCIPAIVFVWRSMAPQSAGAYVGAARVLTALLFTLLLLSIALAGTFLAASAAVSRQVRIELGSLDLVALLGDSRHLEIAILGVLLAEVALVTLVVADQRGHAMAVHVFLSGVVVCVGATLLIAGESSTFGCV